MKRPQGNQAGFTLLELVVVIVAVVILVVVAVSIIQML